MASAAPCPPPSTEADGGGLLNIERQPVLGILVSASGREVACQPITLEDLDPSRKVAVRGKLVAVLQPPAGLVAVDGLGRQYVRRLGYELGDRGVGDGWACPRPDWLSELAEVERRQAEADAREAKHAARLQALGPEERLERECAEEDLRTAQAEAECVEDEPLLGALHEIRNTLRDLADLMPTGAEAPVGALAPSTLEISEAIDRLAVVFRTKVRDIPPPATPPAAPAPPVSRSPGGTDLTDLIGDPVR